MPSHTPRGTVRRSIALPAQLAEEALSLASAEDVTTFNGLVRRLLQRFVEERRSEAFAAAMEEMAHDPAVCRESESITREFLPAEEDGLTGTK